jgi:hypothetical protein
MVEGLVHKGIFTTSEQFFEAIDKAGGWPLGYRYVGFEHTEDRRAGFSNIPICHGYWTTLYNSDDYYFWKLSDEAKRKIIERIVRDSYVAHYGKDLKVGFYR